MESVKVMKEGDRKARMRELKSRKTDKAKEKLFYKCPFTPRSGALTLLYKLI